MPSRYIFKTGHIVSDHLMVYALWNPIKQCHVNGFVCVSLSLRRGHIPNYYVMCWLVIWWSRRPFETLRETKDNAALFAPRIAQFILPPTNDFQIEFRSFLYKQRFPKSHRDEDFTVFSYWHCCVCSVLNLLSVSN